MSKKNGQIKQCEYCQKDMYVKKSLLNRKRFCSRSCQGKITPLALGKIERNNKAWNKGLKGVQVAWNKGLKGYQAGSKNGNWKGGKTKLMDAIRTCAKYKNWRKEVFTRDNYTCQFCEVKDKTIQADHIEPLAILVDNNNIRTLKEATKCKGLWNIDNGRTLCKKCHKETDTYGVNFIRYKKTTAQSGITPELHVTLIATID